MSTRGALGWRYKNKDKLAYNHSDSYPDGLGLIVKDYISKFSDTELIQHYEKTKIVYDKDVPTKEQIEICKENKTTDFGVSNGSEYNWYCLLRNAQGDLEKYANVGIMLDSGGFVYDALFCEYAYIINLDRKILEIYSNKGIDSRYTSSATKEHTPVKLTCVISLKALRAMSDDIFLNAFENEESILDENSSTSKTNKRLTIKEINKQLFIRNANK